MYMADTMNSKIYIDMDFNEPLDNKTFPFKTFQTI